MTLKLSLSVIVICCCDQTASWSTYRWNHSLSRGSWSTKQWYSIRCVFAWFILCTHCLCYGCKLCSKQWSQQASVVVFPLPLQPQAGNGRKYLGQGFKRLFVSLNSGGQTDFGVMSLPIGSGKSKKHSLSWQNPLMKRHSSRRPHLASLPSPHHYHRCHDLLYIFSSCLHFAVDKSNSSKIITKQNKDAVLMPFFRGVGDN